MKKEFTRYGDGWEKEISKLPKSAIIEIAKQIGKDKEMIEQKLIDLENKYISIVNMNIFNN